MIQPGGTPGTAFTKSATTRFNNTQRNAARATMPHNLAAQQSLKNSLSKKNTSGQPPVGTAPAPSSPAMPQVPTGGATEFSDPDFDPAAFAPSPEGVLDELVGSIRTEQFMESPRVKDAVEAVRFKNIMNANNPRYRPDNRNLFQQVVSRMGMDR